MSDLKVCLLQQDLAWENIATNLLVFDTLIKNINTSPDIIVLPEMFTTGFSMNPENLALGMEQDAILKMKEWSALTNAALCGSMMMRENDTYFNRFIWVEPDGSIKHYDKKHLFRMGEENQHYTAGSQHLLIAFRGWNIAPFICYDLRFPVWLRRTKEFNYDCLLFVANWPTRRTKHWKLLAQARAIENQSYVVAVNRVGKDAYDIPYSGDSQVISPLGEVLFHLENEACAETVVLNKDVLNQYRNDFPAFDDADEFKLL
jgi:predicted amidohydrolase